MRPMKSVVTAIAVCVGLTAGLATASAAEAATTMTCLTKAKAVRTALNGNTDTKKDNDAKKQARSGLNYCSHGMFKKGVARYEAALKILGNPSS